MKQVKRKKNKFAQEAKKQAIFRKLILSILAIFVLYNAIFFINNAVTQKQYFSVFGITALSMETDLMQNEINKNDLVLLKKVDKKDLKNGDIIAYQINGKIRINKIINSKKSYVTKSNKNYYPDIEEIEYEQIIGKKIVNIGFWGNLLNILQSRVTSFLILIILIFMIFYNRYYYQKQKIRKKKKTKM